MTEKQLAARINEAVNRYGPDKAVSVVLEGLGNEEIIALWKVVGPRVIREVWRTHRPNLELICSITATLRQLVAIGTSGGKKPLGEITSPELRIIARFRQRSGETLIAQARCLRRIADQIRDRTVGETWAEIASEDRKAMLAAFGISQPESAAVAA